MTLKKTHDIQRSAVAQRTPKSAGRCENEHERLSQPTGALDAAIIKPRAALRPADVLTLQRTAGNRVVQRMLNSRLSLSSPSAQTIQPQTEEEEPVQGKFDASVRTENRSGLPNRLKAGIENLSGVSMDDVRVHYNSPKPSAIRALAYTQGTDIHLGPNEEEHLPHEAWHVVQQKQGRVRPTLQAKGLPINDDSGLEREADMMGQKARGAAAPVVQRKEIAASPTSVPAASFIPFRPTTEVVQLQTMEVVVDNNIKKDTGDSYQGYTKRTISAKVTDEFKTKHIRNDVKKVTAIQAVRDRNGAEPLNTTFQKAEFDTALGTVGGNYHIKQRHRERLKLSVKDVPNREAWWNRKFDINSATQANFDDDRNYRTSGQNSDNTVKGPVRNGVFEIDHIGA